MTDEERKIIIDEDWKSQVQKERERARSEAETKAKPEAEDDAKAAPAPASPGGAAPESPFQALVATLAAQTMFTLGMVASPDSHEVMVDLESSKAIIDMLMALRQKTKGNLTSDEEAQLTEVLAELQRFYALRAQQMTEATLKNSGIDPNTGQPKR